MKDTSEFIPALRSFLIDCPIRATTINTNCFWSFLQNITSVDTCPCIGECTCSMPTIRLNWDFKVAAIKLFDPAHAIVWSLNVWYRQMHLNKNESFKKWINEISVCKAYGFGFTTRLKQINNMLRYAQVHGCLCNEKTVLQQNRVEKGSCTSLSLKSNTDCAGSRDNY